VESTDILTPPWPDPVLQAAIKALVAGDPNPGYASLASGDHNRREWYAHVLGTAGQEHLAVLEAGAQDVSDDANRWLLLGAALHYAAWSARGSATMKHTSPDQRRGLIDLSHQARVALHRAADLAPRDPVPWTMMQSIVKAAPISRDEMHEVWGRLQSLAPDSFAAHFQRLTVLCRQWYGSTDQMLAFTRDRCAELPDGHPLWALVPKSRLEVLTEGRMFGSLPARVYRAVTNAPLKTRAARTEVDAASRRILADADEFAGHPWSTVAHQIFAAYYVNAGRRAQARPHLERGGTRGAPWAWQLFTDDHQSALNRARQSVGL
jgi:hypothetical protein